jgi:hypothetical protein
VFDSHLDDASYWVNYSAVAHPAERARMLEITRDPAWAESLLDYGFRPYSRMDQDPYHQPPGLAGPWVPGADDFSEDPLLVDLQTGWCLRCNAAERSLELELGYSESFTQVQMLLSRASFRDSGFRFDTHRLLAHHPAGASGPFPIAQPLELQAASAAELKGLVGRLQRLFCGEFHARRLWFRGQRQEYLLQRSSAITQQLYGAPSQPSLHPSLGRYAIEHPDRMGFGFAFAGPNHAWKKPFLIWMMFENRHWFERDRSGLQLLADALEDADDDRFARILGQMSLGRFGDGDAQAPDWPVEADDLRQWFFALMKRHEFGVMLQQYGYVTSLLDLTDDLDVALYFTQAAMVDGRMRKLPPAPGRLIYVFAQPRDTRLFRHGKELFWGDEDWRGTLPPRLQAQQAGFVAGSTNRTQNMYANLCVARIRLTGDALQSGLADEVLFPPPEQDLLYATLRRARPALEGLY